MTEQEAAGTRDAEDPLAELVAAVESWDGTEASAARIRQLAGGVALPRRKPAGDVEAAVFLALGARGREAGGLLARLRRNPAVAARFGPFLGDPAIAGWPFHDLQGIDDDEAIGWLGLVHRGPVDLRVERFVRLFFLARRRPVWTTASSAFAELLPKSAALRETARTWWEEALPLAPEAPKSERLAAVKVESLRRHLLHLACAVAAAGGDLSHFTGFSPVAFVERPLPEDPSTASAALLALGALACSERTREIVLPHIERRVGEARLDLQSLEAVRRLADALRSVPGTEELVARIETALRRPGWEDAKTATGQADALWAWLETAHWFAGRGDHAAIGQMRQVAGPAGRALDLRLGLPLVGSHSALGRLCEHLERLLDSDRFLTTPVEERVLAVVESVLLFGHTEVGSLPWQSVIALALGPERAARLRTGLPALSRKDTAGERGIEDLTLALLREALGRQAIAPKLLLWDRPLSEASVVRLASCQSGDVATQAAIQLERFLRKAPSRADQVRLLWRVRQSDPPGRLFRELRLLLREEPSHPPIDPEWGGHPLVELVEAEAALDAQRVSKSGETSSDEGGDRTVSNPDLPVAMADVLDRAGRFLAGAEEEAAVARLRVIAREIVVWAEKAQGDRTEAEGSWVAADSAIARWATVQGSGALQEERASAELEGWSAQVDSLRRRAAAEERATTDARGASREREDLDRLAAEARILVEDLLLPVWLLRRFAHGVRELHGWQPSSDRSGSREWKNRARALLGPDGAIAKWGLWLGEPMPKLAEAWGNLESTWLEVEAARPKVPETLCEAAERSLDRLGEVLRPAAWPERCLVDRTLTLGRDWLKGVRREAKHTLEAATRLEELLDGDERELRNFARDSDRVGALAPVDLRRLHRRLLDNLLFAEAHRLRATVEARGAAGLLPAVWTHLAPLLIGAAAGVFLVLDVGTEWDTVIPFAPGARYLATVGLALLSSFLLLVSFLLPRLRTDRVGTGRLLLAAARVTPLFLVSLVVAGLLCGVVLLTLRGPEGLGVARLLLWGALAQFLGLFLGLMLQGRGAVSED